MNEHLAHLGWSFNGSESLGHLSVAPIQHDSTTARQKQIQNLAVEDSSGQVRSLGSGVNVGEGDIFAAVLFVVMVDLYYFYVEIDLIGPDSFDRTE
jgi:hypothetical protein